MSAISDVKDRIQGQLSGYLKVIRQKVFGANNEHLDFVMDSFYKLNPTQRNGVLAIIIGVIVSFVLGAFLLYFVQINKLRQELNDTFTALHDLKSLKQKDRLETERFEKLLDVIDRKTKSVNFKPFFEKLARETKVPLKSIAERPMDLDGTNPLADSLKEVHVELKISKISIPKLMNFLVDIEKAGNYLRVQNIKISGMYGNKLYFDAELLVRGYKVNNH